MLCPVVLTLSEDEALVLYSWIARLNEAPVAAPLGAAEQRVMWDLEASLEQVLVAPLTRDYMEQVERARQRLIAQDQP